jgi:ArsR family transcriptional regulator, arsenate/arsenite/antimonite-responsive transcriptional repressor
MLDITPSPTDLNQLARWLKVLAEPKRLFIFHMIIEGYQCNCVLGNDLDIPPNLVSYHLRALHKAGLVDMQRDPVDARWVYYSVNQTALNQLNQALAGFFDPERIKPRRTVCGPQELAIPGEAISAS